jgi:hypothetical protein
MRSVGLRGRLRARLCAPKRQRAGRVASLVRSRAASEDVVA